MQSDVSVFAQVMVVIVVSVAALLSLGVGAYYLLRRASRAQPKAAHQVDEARMERMENAVDAIAVEVERISEAQRFAAGLLVDRLPARSPERVGELPSPSAKRTNTPH